MNKKSKDYQEFKICFGMTKRFYDVTGRMVLIHEWPEFGGIRFCLFPALDEKIKSSISIKRDAKMKSWTISLFGGGKIIADSETAGLDEEQAMSTIWRYLSTGIWPMREV